MGDFGSAPKAPVEALWLYVVWGDHLQFKAPDEICSVANVVKWSQTPETLGMSIARLLCTKRVSQPPNRLGYITERAATFMHSNSGDGSSSSSSCNLSSISEE